MSKYVTDYWVELLPNGVYHLCINCTQREIYYHAFNDVMFLITVTEEEFDNYNSDYILEIEQFLPEIKGVYLHSSSKNKDQLSFFWIPFEREWIGKEKVIIAQKRFRENV